MAILEDQPEAPGGPGIPPRWTHSAKDVVGTAYSTASRIWFTVSNGVISEIYYPTIDRPQIRDFQFLISDGESFFHDEHRDLTATSEYLNEHGLGVRITSIENEGRYKLIKEIITDPHSPCVLVNVRLEAAPAMREKLHLYVLLAPHLEVGGWGNSGNAARIAGREFLTAHKNGTWMAFGGHAPFLARSFGFVGSSDGWQDLNDNFKMDYAFSSIRDGNIALTAELDLSGGRDVTLGMSFGHNLHRAVTTLFQALGLPFAEHRQRFVDQWQRACGHFHPLERWSSDGGELYRRSRELLLAHEDKDYPGAIIASLSIPWGESKGDEDLGGYHLVWTRDMVNSATGLMASGDVATALRALIYLACSQQPDGGFPQNFWITGEPYWRGIQLDEVAFPIMLAWRLDRAQALEDFDPYPMVKLAARYLTVHGPGTPQERWEENSGYSPSTLASNIAALICAACMARDRDDDTTADFLEEYADFLESHVEGWTVTRRGFLVPGIARHYVRINPVDLNDPGANEDPDERLVPIRNRPPGAQWEFPAAEIVDPGFLELVRYGIRKPGDPLIEDSLRVVDAVLKTEFPAGPCWRRYSHDGYGQRDDGGAFEGWGRGRPWPLLTGERAHYELAAGRDVRPYISAFENFATKTRLLAEQIWDQADIPQRLMYHGRPTGSAMPLMWAHGEYIKLLRSNAEGQIFDLLPEVAARYRNGVKRRPIEVWKFNRQPRLVSAGCKLRIQAVNSFVIHWTRNEWHEKSDLHSIPTAVGVDFADIDIAPQERGAIRFTFYWPAAGRWEGRDYEVQIGAPAAV